LKSVDDDIQQIEYVVSEELLGVRGFADNNIELQAFQNI
jgi:hypothetical protein